MINKIKKLLKIFSPIDHKISSQFNEIAENNSISQAAQWVLSEINLQVELNGYYDNSQPQIIISNHVSGLDILLLQSVLNREDNYTIAVYATSKMLPASFAKFLLPIYLSGKPPRNKKIIDKLLYYYCTFLENNKSREDAIKLNRKTITEAANKISRGSSVVIFPKGEMGESGTWQPGIGYLIKEITNKYTQIVFTQIKGASSGEANRLVKPSLRRLFFKNKKIEIKINQPISIQEFNSGYLDYKQITKKIETKYSLVFGID